MTAYIISMWISNTATVMMLLSAVLAIIYMTEQVAVDDKASKGLSKALLIGLAYAATIGGMATLVGTPPNMVFFRSYQEAYPDNNDMNFASWFAIGFPVSLVLLIICFFVLKKMFLKNASQVQVDKDYFRNAYRALGPFPMNKKWFL
ncbi:MAG: anion permease [Bacteroidetes bacterium]|nr:anion permease [Bacteroidota bacterium]